MAVVPIVLELVRPGSVVDIGCGLEEWLAAFQEYGVTDILGIDGDYIDRNTLYIPQENFKTFDLNRPFIMLMSNGQIAGRRSLEQGGLCL